MYYTEAWWKENTTWTFLKTEEIHSYKLPPQLYRDSFNISKDLNRVFFILNWLGMHRYTTIYCTYLNNNNFQYFNTLTLTLLKQW